MSIHRLDRVPPSAASTPTASNVFAVEISGYATSADVENLYGLLEGAYALHDKIDVLVRLVDYEGAEWAHVDSHTPRKVAPRAPAREPLRAVGDPDWTGQVAGLLRPRATRRAAPLPRSAGRRGRGAL